MGLLVDDYYQGCLVFGNASQCASYAGQGTAPTDDEITLSVLSGPGLVALLLTCGCVLGASLAAGLTLGIVSLDALDLRVKLRTGTPAEKRCAAKLLPFVERTPHHQVLCTLLLLNSISNEGLPLFLDELVPKWAAAMVSVIVVLFVGEILPSAIFTGPQRLRIAAAFTPVLSVLMFVLTPAAWPLAVALDRMLPEKKEYTSRRELCALVDVQREMSALAAGEAHQPFSEDEADLVRGAMSLSSRSVADVMVPMKDVFYLDDSNRLDDATLRRVCDAGFSRVPVSVKGQTTEYVLVKEMLPLLSFARGDGAAFELSALRMYAPVWIGPNHSLFELLNEFQTGSTHMAFVRGEDGDGAPVGIITLEDIIEEILTEEIYDESDKNVARDVLARFLRGRVLPRVREAARRRASTDDPSTPGGRPRTNSAHFAITMPAVDEGRATEDAFSPLLDGAAAGDADAAAAPQRWKLMRPGLDQGLFAQRLRGRGGRSARQRQMDLIQHGLVRSFSAEPAMEEDHLPLTAPKLKHRFSETHSAARRGGPSPPGPVV
ncbi:hypothetical protein M885DRAFT_481126 [Pelagophyceae sp. CCMP2097]|nr:hypothetical protein M885DRAFT_481126 [Pelagophyceae sp. CCMP2097]